jgi:hypothetical protein
LEIYLLIVGEARKINYFCIVKNRFSYIVKLISAVIIIAVLQTYVYRPDKIIIDNNFQKTESQHSSKCYFDSVNFAEIASGTEHFRDFNRTTSSLFRIIPVSYMFRILRSLNLEQQKYISYHQFYALKYADNQVDGYYLYYLRKLLI